MHAVVVILKDEVGSAECNVAHHAHFPVDTPAVDGGNGGNFDVVDKILHDLQGVVDLYIKTLIINNLVLIRLLYPDLSYFHISHLICA